MTLANSYPWWGVGLTLVIALVLMCGVWWIVMYGFRGEDWKSTYGWNTRMMWAVWGTTTILVGIVIAIASFSISYAQEEKKTARGLGDSGRPERIDGRKVDGVTEMADNFPNVATKCVWKGWRAFVTSNGDHLAVVEDASCRFKDTGPSD